jgi:hypothetical protein
MQPPSQPDLSSIDPTPAFSLVEVAVPLPLSHAWIAYACRAASVAKPRWNHTERVWTTRATTEDGVNETITISMGRYAKSVRVLAEWTQATQRRRESETTRRVVTALVTGMQWAIARRAGRDRAL